jgi:hypothetical protein
MKLGKFLLLSCAVIVVVGGLLWKDEAQKVPVHAKGDSRPSQKAEGPTGSGTDGLYTAPGANASAAAQKIVRSDSNLAPDSVPLLPPPDTPVRDVLAQLQSAASLGEPHAACRVGMELVKCRSIDGLQKLYDAADVSSPPDSRQAIDARQLQESVADEIGRLRSLCDGVGRSQTSEGWRYLLSAASAGSVAAMSQFVRAPGLDLSNPAADAEGWLAYRDNAPRYLARAIAAGDPMSVYFGWFGASTGLSMGGPNVIQRDSYAAVVYGTAILPFLDPRRRTMVQASIDRNAASLTAERNAQAMQDARRIQGTIDPGAANVAFSSNDDTASDPIACSN